MELTILPHHLWTHVAATWGAHGVMVPGMCKGLEGFVDSWDVTIVEDPEIEGVIDAKYAFFLHDAEYDNVFGPNLGRVVTPEALNPDVVDGSALNE